MKALKILPAVLVLIVARPGGTAEEKSPDYAKLAVGTWTVVKAHEGGPPKGGTVEFTKDGKIKVSGEQSGMKQEFDGTYKINGKKLVLTFKIGDQERTVELTIDKLDDKAFETTSSNGKVELTRKK